MISELDLPVPTVLQTRQSFPAIEQTSALFSVQVTDELGLAYLDQDIDFGATGRIEIFQNIKSIVLTAIWSVPLDREFGMDYSMVDKPMVVAEAMLSQEVAMKIALYEPRAVFTSIEFARDELNGRLSPNVHISILSTDELPSAYSAAAGEASLALVARIAPTFPPSFLEILAYIQGIPGPPGPQGIQGDQGPTGVAATIAVGTTSTLSPISSATVTNSGNQNAATFNFGIPRGSMWWSGASDPVTIAGSLPGDYYLNTISGDVFILS